MSATRPWLRVILTAAGLVVLSAGDLTPGRSETLPDAPHPEEIRLLDELSAWAGGPSEEDDSVPDEHLPFPQDRSLTTSVQSRAASFELFCGVPVPREARRRVLAGLPYGDEIERAAGAYQLDALLVAAMVEAESDFEPLALSPKGAVGLMQLMPRTALAMGVTNPQQPVDNIEAGTRYLRQLLHQYDGDIALALAAYNAGPSRVDRFGGVPPFPETTRYVEKVLRRYIGHRRSAWREDVVARADALGLVGR